MRRRIGAGAIAIFCAAGCAATTDDGGRANEGRDVEAITNAPATTAAPYAVSIFIHGPPGDAVCGATILSRHWLVSAAHCFEGRSNGEQVDVNPGTGNIFQGPADFITNPDYGGTGIWGTSDTDDDLALVRLHDAGLASVPATAGLHVAALSEGAPVTIYGFGRGTDPGGSTDCDDGTLFVKRVKQYALTSVETKSLEIDYGSSEICPGDSGSGWQIVFDDRPLVSAVTANRQFYNDADACRVAAKADWIRGTAWPTAAPLACPLYYSSANLEYRDCFEMEQRAYRISAGETHACAVMFDGRVRCWGDNLYGQIGDATFTERTKPVTVHFPNPGAEPIDVAAGRFHTCAVAGGGSSVQCWGWNPYGALGDPSRGATTWTTPSPVKKSDGTVLSGISRVTAGAYHTCALTTAGRVYCWGLGTDGQLGNDTMLSATSAQLVGHWGDPILTSGSAQALSEPMALGVGGGPVFKVFYPLQGIVAIDAGYSHTCAIDTAGSTYCWGDNAYGQLGVGGTTDRQVPTLVPGISAVKAIATGDHHTCVVRGTNADLASCWGWNGYGQLANGTTTSTATPVGVTLSMGAGVTVTAGSAHTCFANGASNIQKCAGHGGNGELGYGSTLSSTTLVQSIVPDVQDSSAGAYFTCSLLGDGSVSCTGTNAYGELGQGNTSTLVAPRGVRNLHVVPELDGYAD